MHKVLYFCLFLFLSSTLQAQTKMSSAEAQILKNQVRERSLSTESLTSDFIQYKHLDFLSNDIVTKGKLSFKAPKKVKWEYYDPFNYAVIFKNEKIYINDDGDKNQVDLSSSTMFKSLSNLIIHSINGNMFNEEKFEISYLKDGTKRIVHFFPKEKALKEFLDAIHITFNDIGDVVEAKMITPSGDYTRTVFSNKKINEDLSDEVFAH